MKTRMSVLYFLQFAVWGCYLTCFGQFLGAGGLGADIAWFYAAIGLVSIITPSLFGRLADRTRRPETLLGACHLAAALLMFVMWRYGMTHTRLEFRIFYPLYLGFLAFYMPTMALANTSSFGLLTQRGYSTISAFPSIRIWGTIGFIAAMWFVNSAYWAQGSLGFAFRDSDPAAHLRFQYNAMQLLCSGILGISTAVYSFMLPRLKPSRERADANSQSSADSPILLLKKMLFGKKEMTLFLIFVIFSGVCLQISNGFATPFINHFMAFREYADSFASGNATMLFSLSQIAEASCVLLVGISLKHMGIRGVYAIGLAAWGLRFLTLATGNPGDGLWLLIASMLIYGIAFNFITIAGHLYIQQIAPANMKGFAQGLMMFLSNGIGATFGTVAAGAIVNSNCHWELIELPAGNARMGLFMGNWETPWLIFAAYAFAIALAWLILYRKSPIRK